MKKLNLIVIAAILTLTSGLSFGQAYTNGGSVFMVGIGAGGVSPNSLYVDDVHKTGGNEVSETGRDVKLTPVTIALNYQKGIHEYISVGAYLSPSFSVAELRGIYHNYNPQNGDLDGQNDGNDQLFKTHFEKRRMTAWFFGVKAEGHFSELIGLIDALDLYAGISLGGTFQAERVYDRQVTSTYNYDNNTTTATSTSELDSYSHSNTSVGDLNVFLGARYYFQDQLGVYVELGAIGTYAQLGLTYKL